LIPRNRNRLKNTANRTSMTFDFINLTDRGKLPDRERVPRRVSPFSALFLYHTTYTDFISFPLMAQQTIQKG
jgi:hypothetical protein